MVRLILVLVVLVSWMDGSVVHAQSRKSVALRDAIQVIQGLKNRRLFDLAELYTEQQLTSESISMIEKSAIVMEEIQTKVAQAIVTTGGQRQASWKQANGVLIRFSRQYPEHPQLLLVQVQDALVYYSHGNLIRQEIAAEIAKPEWKTQALQQFRNATEAFNGIEKEIEKQIPVVRSRTPKPGDITSEQLTNLKNNIRYRLATINLAKAQLYDSADQLNRIDALNQVLEKLEQVITQSGSDVPLWWQAQIARATCFRLKKDISAFTRLVRSLPEEELSVDLQNDLLKERILAAIEFNQRNQFDFLLSEFSESSQPDPELQLAALALLMYDASKNKGDQKKQRQAQATLLVNLIETTQGPYWGRRAEVLLVGSVESSGNSVQPTASSDFEILVRQGESAFRKRNFEDAIKAFEKALGFVSNSNSGDQALQLAVRIAQCFETLKTHDQAAARLLETSQRFQEAKLADAVHLRGCWNLGKVPDASEEMIEALKTQALIWPNSPSTDQARLWLGSTYQNDKQWMDAIEAYNSISFVSKHCLAAVQQMETCAKQIIQQTRNEGGDVEALTRELTGLIQGRLESIPEEGWSEPQRWLLSSLLSIALPAKMIRSDGAVQWLEASSRGETPTDQWRIQSHILKLLATCIDPNDIDPIEVLKALPNDAHVMRRCFDLLRRSIDQKRFDALGNVRQMISDKALADESVDDREFWQIERLSAQVVSADAARAITELKEFAEKYPKSLKVQLAYSRALSVGSDDHEKILKQWRRLAANVPKESPAWFEAKYNIVAQMVENQNQQEAEKLVRYLSISTSSWEQSGWKVRFEKLLKAN